MDWTQAFRLYSSFIDSNAARERVSDRNMNANLCDEVLINGCLYKDEDILVYCKPHNVQTAPGFMETDSLSSRVAIEYNLTSVARDQLIVHRLDYATSGVLVFARNVAALTDLHSQFRLRKTYKRYSALVEGCFCNSLEGEIDLPLTKDLENKPLNKVNPDGKPSLTSWRVVAQDVRRNVSLVHLRPLSGRTHQLRIHMASIGHPILGDFFYAPLESYLRAKRLCLHAEELRLLHPRTRQPMRFNVQSPFTLEDF